MDQQGDTAKLIFCCDFAAKKHANQRRKDHAMTPYINHPLGVAFLITNDAKITDVDILQAAILHDTIEDTETSVEELLLNFGSKVTSIVEELTDNKLLAKEERKRLQIVNAPKKSYGAKIVGMADKIYNLRDLKDVAGWSDERRLEYVHWAEQVVKNYYDANETLAGILRDIFAQWAK